MNITLKPLNSVPIRRHSAFTLVELLVVIAIIGTLTSISVYAVAQVRSVAKKTVCLSNQWQIGIAMVSYTSDNNGRFPASTHSTGSLRKNQSWIFELAPYLSDVDEVRICPAETHSRQVRIKKMKATSYLMNDLVLDNPDHNRLLNIPSPGRTILMFTLSEDRAPSITRDHIHGSAWSSWNAALSDIEPDRHRAGARSSDRTKGSANYLYVDGHVENLSAQTVKSLIEKGSNPAAVPIN